MLGLIGKKLGQTQVYDAQGTIMPVTIVLAGPILLEPIMKVEVATPDEYQGDLLGDINRRRGTITGIEAKGGQTILNAEVPLAEMFGYATAIRSLSKGRASYSMEPLAFEQVPNSVLNAILDSAKSKPAART